MITKRMVVAPRMFLAGSILVPLLVLLAGCATGPAPAPSADLPAVFDVQGLRVPAPPGDGWVLADQGRDRATFARAGDSPAHRWSAWVQAVQTGLAIDGYFPLARLASRIEDRGNSQRMRLVERELEVVNRAGGNCLRRTSRHRTSSNSEDRETTAVDFFCNHPTDRFRLVWVHLSESTQTANSNVSLSGATLRRLADAYLEQVRFDQPSNPNPSFARAP